MHFIIIFRWIEVHFVGPLVSSISDFSWLSAHGFQAEFCPGVLKPGWIHHCLCSCITCPLWPPMIPGCWDQTLNLACSPVKRYHCTSLAEMRWDRTCSVICRTKLLVRPYLLPLKTNPWNCACYSSDLDSPVDQHVPFSQWCPISFNDKISDRSTVWSDGPQNKYNPALLDTSQNM